MEIISKFKNFLKEKSGVFNQVSSIMVGLAGLAVTAVVTFLLLSKTKANSTVAADPNATAALGTLQSSGDDTVSFVPLIVIAAIGAVLISLVNLYRASQ